MSSAYLAFYMGLFGSLHCALMCGPLVISLPFGGSSFLHSLLQRILYQAGRITVYAVLGFVAGSLGRIFNILGQQQLLSLIAGIALVSVAVFHFLGKPFINGRFANRLVMPLASNMGKWLSRSYGGLLAGAINGLLPCAMVYMALTASLAEGTALQGARFMLLFGAGTTPLLFLTSLVPAALKRARLSFRIVPILFLVTGSILIARGMNVAIAHLPFHVEINGGAPECVK